MDKISRKMNKIMMAFALCLSITSCVKDEAPNKECDIESAWVEGEELEKNFYQTAAMYKENISSTETSITFIVRSMTMLPTQIPVNFKITAGASIEPANGSPQDFTKGAVTYTVTSEDRQWSRSYKVAFAEPELLKSKYSFEHADTAEGGIFIKNFYHQFYEPGENGGKQKLWTSGNPGFALTQFYGAGPEQFPTYMTDYGYEGHGVRLETMSAGDLGISMGKPIAAGNLFLGRFIVEQTAVDPLKATEFGVRWDKDPLRVTGYYKYQPGEDFTNDNMEIVPDRTDEASIYAVFYRNVDADGKPYFLYGDDVADLDKVMDNPQVYKMACVTSLPPTDQWTRFEMFFEGIDAPAEMVANHDFNLAIVFSSSKSGAWFEGAIGSTLYIDEVEVWYEK